MNSMIRDAVTVLHNRLKQLTPEANPEHLAYLAKSIESIGGQGTLLEIVSLTDEKLLEIANAVASHQQDLTTAKDNHLTLMDQAKSNHLTALTDSVNAQVTQIDSLAQNFNAVNDVPQNSSIMGEIKAHDILRPGSLPFIFGILSRASEHFCWGGFTTELGQWHADVNNTNHMLALLAGAHDYTIQYNLFRQPPHLQFFQGARGSFVFGHLYEMYSLNSNQYNYPHAVLGALFVKNTTGGDITSKLDFGGCCRWSSGYEGAGLFLGVPNDINDQKGNISSITWTNLYTRTENVNHYDADVMITFPANKTSVILLYNSAYHYTGNYNRLSHLLHWNMQNVRSELLAPGLEMDFERTVKAWQSEGLEHTYQIWN